MHNRRLNCCQTASQQVFAAGGVLLCRVLQFRVSEGPRELCVLTVRRRSAVIEAMSGQVERPSADASEGGRAAALAALLAGVQPADSAAALQRSMLLVHQVRSLARVRRCSP